MVDSVAVEAIVAAINYQYIKELKKDYVGLKTQNIKTMVTQINVWYVITTKEKLDIKANFLTPRRNNTEEHITTFVCQLDRFQVK